MIAKCNVSKWEFTWLGGVYGEEPAPEAKTFTQEDLNKFLAEDRRKHQSKLENLQKELEKLQGTAKEKETLSSQVEELKRSLMTKEEIAKADAEKRDNEFKQVTTQLSTERDRFKGLFESTLAKQAISAAAVANKAFSVEQLEMLMLPQVKVVPVTDNDGNQVGFNVVAPVKLKDKVVELPVTEAVSKLREQPAFANLFLVDGPPGTGRTINNGGSTPTSKTPPSDPGEYRKWREQNKG